MRTRRRRRRRRRSRVRRRASRRRRSLPHRQNRTRTKISIHPRWKKRRRRKRRRLATQRIELQQLLFLTDRDTPRLGILESSSSSNNGCGTDRDFLHSMSGSSKIEFSVISGSSKIEFSVIIPPSHPSSSFPSSSLPLPSSSLHPPPSSSLPLAVSVQGRCNSSTSASGSLAAAGLGADASQVLLRSR